MPDHGDVGRLSLLDPYDEIIRTHVHVSKDVLVREIWKIIRWAMLDIVGVANDDNVSGSLALLPGISVDLRFRYFE